MDVQHRTICVDKMFYSIGIVYSTRDLPGVIDARRNGIRAPHRAEVDGIPLAPEEDVEISVCRIGGDVATIVQPSGKEPPLEGDSGNRVLGCGALRPQSFTCGHQNP